MGYTKRGDYTNVPEYCDFLLGGDALRTKQKWEADADVGNYTIARLSQATMLIREFINLPILIITDHDADGKPGGVLLFRALRRAGYKYVFLRVTHRLSEGYGAKPYMIDEMDELGVPGLVIFIDNGITCLETVDRAREKGWKTLILDHHMADRDPYTGYVTLPEADVIVDPEAIPYSAVFSDYCGCGLSYRVAVELLHAEGIYDTRFEQKLCSLAAISTVCDIVTLRQENSVIVKRGLQYLNDGITFSGVKALIEVLGLRGHVTETDIGFKIGSSINADTRLYDNSSVAMELMLEDDPLRASNLALQLKGINEERKAVSDETYQRAAGIYDYLSKQSPENFQKVCIMNIGAVHEGVIGLTCSKVCENLGIPVILFAETPDGILKGSGRSIPGVDLYSAVVHAKPVLETFGGHPGACGLSVKKENFRRMKEIIYAYMAGIELPEKKNPEYDLEIHESEFQKAYDDLQVYGPFGEGYPSPIFRVIVDITPKDGEYYRLLKKDGVRIEGQFVSGIGFGLQEKIKGCRPKKAALYGTLSQNYFRGNVTPQVVFEDIEILEEYPVDRPSFLKGNPFVLKY